MGKKLYGGASMATGPKLSKAFNGKLNGAPASASMKTGPMKGAGKLGAGSVKESVKGKV